MVQRPGGEGRAGGELRRTRMHGHQALRLRHLGEDARRAGQDVQGDGASERLFPALHPQILLLEGGSPRRGLRQGVRRGNALPPEERPRRQGRRRGSRRKTRGGAHRAPHLGDDHLEYLQELDPVLPRPADPVQPVGQRRTLGDAHAPVPAHRGVPLAGGTYGARHARGGHRGGHEDDPRLRKVRHGVDVAAGDRGPQVAQRAFRRRRGHADDRGADAGRQGAAERHVALPGPELRQSLRRAVCQ